MKKLLILLALALLSACGMEKVEPDRIKEDIAISEKAQVVESQNIEDEEKPLPTQDSQVSEVVEEEPSIEDVDLSIEPNEAGSIMILSYHYIGDEEERYTVTPEMFTQDLQKLYDKGYLPISLDDFLSGNITTPAGKTPYLITFDDGDPSNMSFDEDHEVDIQSAVGLLLAFAMDHPGFQPHATFFVSGDQPFGSDGKYKEKFALMIKEGMDIGSHSASHAHFSELGPDELQAEIGRQYNFLNNLVSEGYSVDTLALPYGEPPLDEYLQFLEEGSFDGREYKNRAVFYMGWTVNPSPYDKDHSNYKILRLRASEFDEDNLGLSYWLDYFDENPNERFISDGYSQIVSVPMNKVGWIKDLEDKTLLAY